MDTQRNFSVSRWLRSRTGLVLLGFLAIAAFFLLTEHTAHVFGVLPYALLLLCPLLHLFMHGGHGGRADHSNGQKQRSEGGQHEQRVRRLLQPGSRARRAVDPAAADRPLRLRSLAILSREV